MFLLVRSHFSTCANLLHNLKAVQLLAHCWGSYWGCRAFRACLDAKQNWRNSDSLIPGSFCSAGGCEENHIITALPRNQASILAKNKPGAHVATVTNTSTASLAEHITVRRLSGRQKGINNNSLFFFIHKQLWSSHTDSFFQTIFQWVHGKVVRFQTVSVWNVRINCAFTLWSIQLTNVSYIE